MNNYKWKENPTYQELPEIELGDMVSLEMTDEFQYNINAIVIEIGESGVMAEVSKVFDKQMSGVINGHELKGLPIKTSLKMIQKVIKK